MKFVHTISIRATPSQRREMEALGLKLPVGILPGETVDPLLIFDVDEDHPNWQLLAPLLEKWNAFGMSRTEFTKAEIDGARWLKIGCNHHGYPQPRQDDFGYLQATYDLTDWCEKCFTGGKQDRPFQMKGEPKVGRNGIWQLNWIFDELFVTPEVWATVFEPHGIRSRPVTNTEGVELKTVVQLVIEAEVSIVPEGIALAAHQRHLERAKRCATCGRLKYVPATRGAFPRLTEEPSAHLARTRECFQNGSQALIIAQDVARSLASAKVRGAAFIPVQGETPQETANAARPAS